MLPMPSRFVFAERLARAALAWGLGLGTLTACRPGAGGATLQIEAPREDTDADVYVDGHYIGQVSALKDQGVELAPGVHRLEIRKPGRFPVQKTIEVDAATPAIVVVEAELLEDPR